MEGQEKEKEREEKGKEKETPKAATPTGEKGESSPHVLKSLAVLDSIIADLEKRVGK